MELLNILGPDFTEATFSQRLAQIVAIANANQMTVQDVLELLNSSEPDLLKQSPTVGKAVGEFLKEVSEKTDNYDNLISSGKTREEASAVSGLTEGFLDSVENPFQTPSSKLSSNRKGLRKFMPEFLSRKKPQQAMKLTMPPRPMQITSQSRVIHADSSAADSAYVEEDDEEDEMFRLAEGLTYKGFDTAAFRADFQKTNDFKVLVQLLTTYIFVGNNFEEKLQKVSDAKIGGEMLKQLNKAGFDVRKTRFDSRTLSRLGVSYAPLLLLMRRKLESANKLPVSNISGCDDNVKCDLALAGRFGQDPDYANWYLNFAEVLNSADRRNAVSADEARKKAKQYLNSAISGSKSDKVNQRGFQLTDMGSMKNLYGFM